MNHANRKAFLLSFAILVLSTSAHSQSPANPEKSCKSCLTNSSVLEPDKPIELPIAAGETHSYTMTLAGATLLRSNAER